MLVTEHTLSEKVLLAARRLEEAGQSPFSAEALIVSAWQLYPRTFGLKGFEDQYPDSNKVLAGIMGSRGLPQKGWLAKVGAKLYTLTREGLAVVGRLQAGEDVPPPATPRPARLPRDLDLLVQRLLASGAWQKFVGGRKLDWTFREACQFWGLGDEQGGAVRQTLRAFSTALGAAEKSLATGPVALGNGVRVTGREAVRLLELHDQLEQRFSRHLLLLESRSDR